MGLNSGFGLQKISGSEQWMRVHDERLGNRDVPVGQRYAADGMLRLIQDLDLVPVNLHIGKGPTYYGTAGSKSKLDYVFIPRRALQQVTSADPLRSMARELQRIGYQEHRDHPPVHVRLAYSLAATTATTDCETLEPDIRVGFVPRQ
eukprot:7238674-Pyramimonas_sp.AAC.1